MTLTDDLRLMLASSAALTDLPTTALVDGVAVAVMPGVATAEDVAMGGGTIAGTEKTLRMAAADVPHLRTGSAVVWNSKAWTVHHRSTAGNGALVKVFLREAL